MIVAVTGLPIHIHCVYCNFFICFDSIVYLLAMCCMCVYSFLYCFFALPFVYDSVGSVVFWIKVDIARENANSKFTFALDFSVHFLYYLFLSFSVFVFTTHLTYFGYVWLSTLEISRCWMVTIRSDDSSLFICMQILI